MNLVTRIRNLLLSPQSEWQAIADEPDTVAGIYSRYLVFLAAIPAVAGFIGLSIFGIGGFGITVRVPVLTGLVQMVVSYGLSLAMVYLLAWVIDALASAFGARRDRLRAFKLAAYSITAAMLAGIFALLPSLAILGLVGAAWSVWLLYLGLPALMRCPADKAVPYTASVVVVAIVASLVVSALAALVLPSPSAQFSGGAGGSVAISTPQGEVTLDTTRMAEAARRLEAAAASGDAARAGEAAGAMAQAMGAGSRKPVAAEQLKVALPQRVQGMERQSFEAQNAAVMGFATASAEADYAAGDRSLRLSITDTGGLSGVAAMAGWVHMTGERESDGRTEKVYRQGARTLREEVDKEAGQVEFTVVLTNGVIVQAEAYGLELASVRQAVESLDLTRLEALAAP